MQLIWQYHMSFKAAELMTQLELSKPPRFIWANAAEITRANELIRNQYKDHEFWEYPSLSFEVIPVPKIIISDSKFNYGYITRQGYQYASRKLRSIIGIDGKDVRFRQVDTSLSVPEIQELGYEAFDVLNFANPFDAEKMTGVERDVRQPDGSIHREWLMDYMNTSSTGSEVYFRNDFTPPAPLFRAKGTLWTFATDEFAERVMRAGIDDMLFIDISGPSNRPLEDRIRRLR